MNRYNIIKNKNQREIVLLKAFPCAWGKCSFCDYTEDNSNDELEMMKENREVLKQVTGELLVLEVINSGSCFELPRDTLEYIKDIVIEKNIKRLYFEAHWMYRNKLDEMRVFMGVEIIYKIGVETFCREFRENILNKNAGFTSPQEVREYFDSPCLMVGIKGQTKEMIDQDIELLKKYFLRGTINIYINNSTPIKRDNELVEWFMDKYNYLEEDPNIEVLYENTDFGVGA